MYEYLVCYFPHEVERTQTKQRSRATEAVYSIVLIQYNISLKNKKVFSNKIIRSKIKQKAGTSIFCTLKGLQANRNTSCGRKIKNGITLSGKICSFDLKIRTLASQKFLHEKDFDKLPQKQNKLTKLQSAHTVVRAIIQKQIA